MEDLNLHGVVGANLRLNLKTHPIILRDINGVRQKDLAELVGFVCALKQQELCVMRNSSPGGGTYHSGGIGL
jgi:hypothetical protein